MLKEFNTRILVVDDEESIRDSFKEILCPDRKREESLNELNAAMSDLLGGEADVSARKSPEVIEFQLDEAPSGKAALELVERACAAELPYAVIFVDMRMPGWDGLETATRIRQLDSRAEIVFVTAYSDHSIEEIVKRAGNNVTYHCKPFSVEEIQQIATKSVYEWNKSRNLEDLITVISEIRAKHWHLDQLLENILSQVSEILGCQSALLAIRRNDHYDILVATGMLANPDIAGKYLERVPQQPDNQLYELGDMLFFKLEAYGIITLFERSGVVHRERIYLVRLFLEQAAATIRNIDLQEELLRKEKLSAVGQAISMLSHDQKNYLGAISGLAGIALNENSPSVIKDYLEQISQASQTCLKMIADVLDFTRGKAVEKQPLNRDRLLAEITAISEEIFDKHNIRVQVQVDPDLTIHGDFSKICRIISNLLRNAAESLTENCCSSPKIALKMKNVANGVGIEVSDNGPGIPESMRECLFDAFTTYGKSDGTGLGLAIVKQFAEAHGGDVEVESSPSGVCFTVFFPMDTISKDHRQSKEPPEPQFPQ